MGVPIPLSAAQRAAIERLAAAEPPSWRVRFYETLSDLLLGLGSQEITDRDVNSAARRAANVADGEPGDFDDCA
jgi:hypothetical protein